MKDPSMKPGAKRPCKECDGTLTLMSTPHKDVTGGNISPGNDYTTLDWNCDSKKEDHTIRPGQPGYCSD